MDPVHHDPLPISARRTMRLVDGCGGRGVALAPDMVGPAPGLPAEVWLRGTIGPGRRIAIVGARAATNDAMRFARTLAERLAAEGRVVVSGGAMGIDAAAHEGALAAGGQTIAVLGTGVDEVYPVRHASLFHRIAESGALVSPFAPGTPPRAHHFPKRNPIIAAMAEAVVVVEAGARSGSLGTAAAARTFGRALWARAGSPGCDALIVERAARGCADVDALVEALFDREVVLDRVPLALDATHAALQQPATADELAAASGRAVADVLADLMELEILRRAIRLDDGRYLAFPPPADLKE